MNSFKQCKIDGVDILSDGSKGIYYTRRDRKRLSTSDESVSNDGADGRTVSKTFASHRIITLEGIIDRLGNSLEEDALLHLQDIFRLHNDAEGDERTLYIKDDYDNERTITVKVKEPFDPREYDENVSGIAYARRVVLESTEEPEYRSLEEILVSGIEGETGGTILGTTLGVALDDYMNLISCTALGKEKNPARIEMTATGTINSPLHIRNITKGTYFGLDIDAVPGDVIIVDTNDFTATKNGVDIVSSRIPDSARTYIQGTTTLVIEDLDGAVPDQDMNINIYFKNSIL